LVLENLSIHFWIAFSRIKFFSGGRFPLLSYKLSFKKHSKAGHTTFSLSLILISSPPPPMTDTSESMGALSDEARKGGNGYFIKKQFPQGKYSTPIFLA
jgi:hypothetical protein